MDWRNPASTPLAEFFALRAQPAFGEFTAGYDNSMGFMRSLIIQRVREGESVDQAVREISRGSAEGWCGHDHLGGQRPGLTSRMRDRLGASWDPVDAMLDWTLSHAADDLTGNSRFQDHASLRIWDLPPEQEYGWRPAAVLSASQKPATTFTRRGGSPHFLYLRDEGGGIDFSISSDTPALEWRLMRIR